MRLVSLEIGVMQELALRYNFNFQGKEEKENISCYRWDPITSEFISSNISLWPQIFIFLPF